MCLSKTVTSTCFIEVYLYSREKDVPVCKEAKIMNDFIVISSFPFLLRGEQQIRVINLQLKIFEDDREKKALIL